MLKSLIAITLLLNIYSINAIDSKIETLKSIARINEEMKNVKQKIPYDTKIDTISTLGYLEMYEILAKIIDYANTNTLNDNTTLSPECALQIQMFLPSITTNWGLSFFDSFGKPGSGIFKGNKNFIGDYHECKAIKIDSIDWYGKYCQVRLADSTFGICMPNKCSNIEIAKIINDGISQYKSELSKIPLFGDFIPKDEINGTSILCPEQEKFDTQAIFALVIVSIIISFVIIGTAFDVYRQIINSVSFVDIRTALDVCRQILNRLRNEDDYPTPVNKFDSKEIEMSSINAKENISGKNIAHSESFIRKKKEDPFFRILLAFSAYSNFNKIFTIKKSQNDDQLDCLHAIRFLSMSWVVLGHTFGANIAFSTNPLVLYGWLPRWSMAIVNQGVFSVDTFFLLSGILCSYLFVKEIAKRRGRISVLFMAKFYIHRIWRITPPYALMIMVAATLTKYMGSGPLYPYDKGLDENCRTNWWTNILYVNNLVNTPKMCFGISWYLANDMQFYFFSPLLLIPLALGYQIFALIIAGTLIVLSMVITSILLYNNKGSELGVLAQETRFMDKVYFTPWCRMGPFVIGVIVGYMIYKCKKNNYKINKLNNILGWLISLFLMGLLIFGTYRNTDPNPAVHLKRAENILYQSTCRTIWAMALGFIIFSCVLGHGGFMNEMFSWPAWIPLSRLSFSAYLVHMLVIYWYNLQVLGPVSYTELIMSYEFIGHMVMSYAFALVVALLFESPMVGLEKLIFACLH